VLPREVEALRGVDVASVSAGFGHALALTYTGGVYSWGHYWLALGHSTPSGGDTLVGKPPRRLPRRIEALRGVRVRCISAGRTHSCAVTDDGHVYTWGDGPAGILGHMEFRNELLPRRVEVLYDQGVLAVGAAAGAQHTLVAGADGAVWIFGSLNAIGAWNHPTVRAMREADDGSVEGDGGLFAGLEYEVEHDAEPEVRDCFGFLYPRGRASICMPVRIPVDVRGSVLHSVAPFVR
jgi:alpha-tubulin suppressor-like RCC1 family protein